MLTSVTRHSCKTAASIDATSATRSSGSSGQRNPSASRGSSGDDSEMRNSPPPGTPAARCALITATGSPTDARSRLSALLANSVTAASRLTA
jgi:hypothetical protein